MTAKEVMEQIERLPKEEQEKLFAHYMGVQAVPGAVPASCEVSERFRRIAAEMFTENSELFKKLSD